MTQDEYKEFLAEQFSQDYSVGDFYLAKKYDLVAQSVQDENFSSKGHGNFLNSVVYIVSFGCDKKFVKKEIDALPQIALSGFRNPVKDKTTTIVRVFVMDEIPFDLIQEVRAFKFSRSEFSPHRSYTEARVLLVDFSSGEVYANLAGEANAQEFKIRN
ncbi:MAG: hypothetical protein HDR37_07190 [Treponema sp.]|nr:hypothetical protein [Treponema sp.]